RPWLARPLAAAIWLCLGFLVTSTLELAWPTEQGTMLFAKVGYAFSTPIPVTIFLFSLAYTGRPGLFAGARWLVLLVVPALTTALALTEPMHHLIWAAISYAPYDGMLAMTVTYGPLFWAGVCYDVALLGLSLALFAWRSFQAGSAYRAQSILAVTGICVPLLLFLVYAFRVIPGFTTNFSPIADSVPALFLVAAIRQHRFLDLVPIARRTVVEDMADAMVVVDPEYRVLDVNGRARAVLGLGEDAVGSTLPPGSSLRQALETTLRPGAPQEIGLGHGGRQRYFDARVTEVHSRRRRVIGSIVLLRDVTDTHTLLEEKSLLIDNLMVAVAEIEDLRGIIPICMDCKKVRDDAGFWHAVEQYIAARSAAQFSHSLCPDCFKKRYPS
ncbi:MAG TPA: histidine kinase N-terminal 7TM domain-containing protein, partial [bacterium]|nr:histidine kinase N-terminal 7TM domain-containing protein [bacterium]